MAEPKGGRVTMLSRVIESADAFAALRAPYGELAGGGAASSPFSTHRWLLAWWRAYEEVHRIRALALYREGRLAAALPVMLARGSLGRVPVRRASAFGPGWGIVDVRTTLSMHEWIDPLVQWLLDDRWSRWTTLRLGPWGDPVGSDSMRSAFEHRGIPTRMTEHANPFLRLPGSWEAFLAGRSKNFRRTVKRKERLIEDGSALAISHVMAPTADDLARTVFRVSAVSWQGAGGLALASTPAGRRFYANLAQGDQHDFVLHLTTIGTAHECAGYLLGVERGGAYHAFDTGFDPRHAELSPGLLLHFAAIREACARGLAEFNFGFEHGYKERFEPESRPTWELLAFRTRLAAGFDRLVDIARRRRARPVEATEGASP